MSPLNKTEKLKQIPDSPTEGVVIQNNEGIVIDYNEAALHLLGLTADQLVGRDSKDPRWKSIHTDGSEFSGDMHPAMQTIRTGEAVLGTMMGIEVPDKGLRWLHINSFPLPTESGMNAIVRFHDISHLFLKIMENESYSTGLNRHAIVARTDRAGKIVHANDNFCKISGYSREELIGKDHRIINSGHHDKSFFEEMWQQILSGNTWRGQIKNKRKDGSFYWVDTTISPVIDPRNHIIEFLAIRYDISDQKQYEEELRAALRELDNSWRLLKSIQDNAAHAIISGSKYGIVTSFNRKAEEMLGYTADELVGKQTPAVFHDLEEVVQRSAEFSEALGETIEPGFDTFVCHSRLGKKNEFEWIYVHKNGTKFPVLLSITTLKDTDGVVTGYLGIAQDLTAHKKLEKDLKQTNRYLELALDTAGLGVWDWNLKTNEVRFDDKWLETLGFSTRDSELVMSYQEWESRIHPDDKEIHTQELQECREGKTDSYENSYRIQHKNGSWLHILNHGTVSEKDTDGIPTRITGTVLDITKTKEAHEQKITELNDILSSTPSCLKIIDRQGLDLIGAEDFSQVKGTCVYDIVAESYRNEFIEFNQRICSGEKESLIFEIVGLDGTRRWMETYAAPYKLPSGELAHIAITNDITKRIEAEDDYKKQKALAQHNAKLASIGELAAGVGHEINNPLAIVKGYIANMRKRIKTGENVSPDELESYFERIDTASDRIVRIVKGLRTLSRSEVTEESDFSPLAVVQESYDMLKEIYERDGIDLRLNNENVGSETIIRGNVGNLQQVLMNLIANAKDALLEKEDKEKKWIGISIAHNNKIIEISIMDNGSGIPEEIKERIFDPFFTTKDVNQGTGIGLSLVQKFIKEMNGELTVISKENEGSEFKIEIPIQILSENELETKSHESFLAENEQETLLHKTFDKKAIVAEDEEGIRDLLVLILEDHGLEVTAVENGMEAYELYRSNPGDYDLLISDMKMPLMDGPTLAHSIRSEQGLKQPKIIFITGGININLEEKHNNIARMIDGFFLKPFGEKEILDVLTKCFRNRNEDVA